MKLKQFENFKYDGNREVILSNLLDEIRDKSLQMILRRIIFKGEDVMNALIKERPELKKNPIKLNKLMGK